MKLEQLEEKISRRISYLKGKVGIIIQSDKGLISHNGEEIFTSASLIKIPILFTAFYLAEKKRLNMDEKVLIKDIDKVEGSGILHQISNITLSIKDLLTLMITVSDNTATNIILDKLGFKIINTVSKEIGCNHTTINRKMMDLAAIEEGKDNFTTPHDMYTFLKEITKGEYLSLSSRNEIYRILSSQQLNDKLTLFLKNKDLFVAHKTGELPGIEHDVAIFNYMGKQILVSMLYDGSISCSAEKTVFADIGCLIFEYLR